MDRICCQLPGYALALVLLTLPLGAAAKVYRCNTEDGKIEYSDKPCGEEVQIEDTTHFGNAAATVDAVADPSAPSDPPEDGATGDAPATPTADVEPSAPSTRDRDRIAADYDRRLDTLRQRIADLNRRISEARSGGRSPEFLADLNDQKRELREQSSALAAEKAAALAEFGDDDG